MPFRNRNNVGVGGIAPVAAIGVIAIGISVLVGWLADIRVLRGSVPGLVTMAANTALCFLLCGIALFLAHTKQPSRGRRNAASLLAGMVLLISLATLFEIVTGFDLGIDEFIAVDADETGQYAPGRMALATTCNFIVIALSTLLNCRTQIVWPAQIGALSVVMIGLFIVGGYFFDARSVYRQSVDPVAVPTAIAFVILGLGVLLSRTQDGLTELLKGNRGIMFAAAFSLIVLLGGATTAYFNTLRVVENERWVFHTTQVQARIEQLISFVKDAEIGQRGYLLTGKKEFLQSYERAGQSIPTSLDEIFHHIADNAQQQSAMKRLEFAISGRVATLRAGIEIYERGGEEQARQHVDTGAGSQQMDEVRRLATEMLAEEAAHLKDRQTDSRESVNRLLVVSGLATAMAIGAVGFVIMMYHRDIRERNRTEAIIRESETRYRTLVESMSAGVVQINREGLIEASNARARAILQRPVLEGANALASGWRVVRPDGTSMPPEEYPSAYTMRTGKPCSDILIGLEQDDGVRWISVNCEPLATTGTATNSIVCTFVDVTKLKDAEEATRKNAVQLASANRELEHKNQENELFVYSVSHDLRTPLVNLQGFSKELERSCHELKQLLHNSEIPEPVRIRTETIVSRDIAESLHYILNGVMRLSGIIDALLRLSRAGRVEYQWQDVDVQTVVRRVVDSLQGTIHEKGIQVEHHTLPPMWGDPIAIEQLFANLIGNAVNYLDPKRSGRIEIGCRNGPTSDPNKRQYFVKDNGLGIDPAHQNKIFRAFQRIHATVASGEGIGLTVVRRVIDRHYGRIWVESQPGEGSVFVAEFPVR